MTNNDNKTKPTNHILTIVVEDYFQVGAFSKLIPKEHWDRFEVRLKQNVLMSIEMLAQTNNKATFFVSGWVAENHPGLLHLIINNGHEIACLGYFDDKLENLSKKEAVENIKSSKRAIEQVTGKAVQGFRIGRGWLDDKNQWLLNELIEEEFEYDSSLCRIGFSFWNQPERGTIHTHQNNGKSLYEIPASSISLFGVSIPVSGGNYWRQFPSWLIKRGIDKWLNQYKNPLVLYFHIWELDPEQPDITAIDMMQKIRHYRNLTTMKDKVQNYLDEYNFVAIAEYLNLSPAKSVEIIQSPGMSTEPEMEAEIPDNAQLADSGAPLTLIVPCYNEEKSLPYLKKTLESFQQKSLGVFKLSYIFVDDGSADSTWEILQEQFSDKENTTLVQHGKNKGIAAALITGFGYTATELTAVIDADCTFSPDQLLKMMPLLTDDVDVVAASPAHKQGVMANVAWWRVMLSKGAAVLYRVVLHQQLTSYTSCFRLYRTKAIRDAKIYNSGFCGVTEILARMDLDGAKIVEYPAVLEVRLLGESKINVMHTTIEHIMLILHLAANRWFGKKMPENMSVETQILSSNERPVL